MNESQTMNRTLHYKFRADRDSPWQTVKPVHLYCRAPAATTVCLIGDFNAWQPGANPMSRRADGAWSTEVQLPHGHHRYQFLVDGEPVLDPDALGTTRNDENQRVSLLAVS